jgi:TetR/AcrR family transcriptional regulator, transcriptional repressor for nem operon
METMRVLTGPGRRQLSPEFLAAFRRQRLMQATAELSRERGYRATSVTDIAARTRMGRGTVYGLFSSREEIFLATVDYAAGRMAADVSEACGAADTYPRRVRSGIEAGLAWVAEEPEFAFAFLVDAQSATERAAERYREALDDLASMLSASTPERESRPATVDRMMVGGIVSVVARNVQAGRARWAPELLPELTGFILGCR